MSGKVIGVIAPPFRVYDAYFRLVSGDPPTFFTVTVHVRNSPTITSVSLNVMLSILIRPTVFSVYDLLTSATPTGTISSIVVYPSFLSWIVYVVLAVTCKDAGVTAPVLIQLS